MSSLFGALLAFLNPFKASKDEGEALGDQFDRLVLSTPSPNPSVRNDNTTTAGSSIPEDSPQEEAPSLSYAEKSTEAHLVEAKTSTYRDICTQADGPDCLGQDRTSDTELPTPSTPLLSSQTTAAAAVLELDAIRPSKYSLNNASMQGPSVKIPSSTKSRWLQPDPRRWNHEQPEPPAILAASKDALLSDDTTAPLVDGEEAVPKKPLISLPTARPGTSWRSRSRNDDPVSNQSSRDLKFNHLIDSPPTTYLNMDDLKERFGNITPSSHALKASPSTHARNKAPRWRSSHGKTGWSSSPAWYKPSYQRTEKHFTPKHTTQHAITKRKRVPAPNRIRWVRGGSEDGEMVPEVVQKRKKVRYVPGVSESGKTVPVYDSESSESSDSWSPVRRTHDDED